MRKSQKKYDQLEILPVHAVTVRLYAESKGISTAHVYKQVKAGKLTIKVFQGVNFVV